MTMAEEIAVIVSAIVPLIVGDLVIPQL